MGRPAKVIEPEVLPTKITMAVRVLYEIGNSGVHRDLEAGDVITDPDIIAEVIAFGASWY